MSRNRFAVTALLVVVLSSVFGASRPIQAQDDKTPYPEMAPLDQYLIANRSVEIAMARSAAPEGISRDAEVLVLTLHGYETAVKGYNGFVCLVERGWMSRSNAVNFWNPKVRGPICYNPQAARTILPLTYQRTKMVLAGQSKTQIVDGIMTFLKQKLPPLEPGAMSYMMSKEQYLTDSTPHNWKSHLMFYTPLMNGFFWGADVPNSPIMLGPQYGGEPEPFDLFMIAAGKWSDGSPDTITQ